MRTVDEAGKLGRAFRLGLAFAFGKRFCAHGVASDEARWITVHPNGRGTTRSGDKAKGQPVLIDGQTGEVLGGMGGKFTGRHISAVPKGGKEEQHGAQMTIEKSHQTQGKPETKSEESAYQKLSRKGVRIDEQAFEKFPESVAKQSAQKVAEIVEFVPWLSDYLNSKENRVLDITSKNLRQETLAHVESSSRGDQKLVLNMNWFKNEQKLLDEIKKSVENRWMMPCSPEDYLSYTIAHEMGHVIHNALYEKTLENRIKNGELSDWDLRWGLKSLQKLRLETLKNLRSEIIRVVKEETNEKTQKAIIEKHVSEYGRSSPAEFIAEAVANAFCGNPNPIGNAMRKVLSQMRL